MKCPYCGKDDLKVNDTRMKDNFIRRKRQCIGCLGTFYTIEMIDLSEVRVQKKNGNLEPFGKHKILNGLTRAFSKINISTEQITNLLDEIEMEIYSLKTNIITSDDIGSIVLKYLKKINDIAYIRFLSVYKRYNSIEKFYEDIAKVIEEKKD
ncbi:transcriptional repressor NrdR [bacterium]|nr:transcriptional repressor NrdR [bacterium]